MYTDAMKAGIVGASGYTGAELLRLLSGHPDIEVAVVTAHSHAGQAVGAHTPSLAAAYPGLTYEDNDPARRLYQRCGFVPAGERQPLPSNPRLYEVDMIRPL